MPITKNIIENITKNKPIDVDELNVDTAFKVTWACFLSLGEITYTGTELKKTSFSATNVTRSDVSFSKGNQYTVICHKQNKIVIEHIGVQIVHAVTGEKTCLVAAPTRFYTLDFQPANTPLFRLSSGIFSRFSVGTVLKKHISLVSLTQSDYSGHSFCKSATQHAADYSMLDEMI